MPLVVKCEWDLARRIGATPEFIAATAEHADQYCRKLEIIDPKNPDRVRIVTCIRDSLRILQRKIYGKLLLPNLTTSPHSFGGIKGRSIKDNAAQHAESTFAFTCDISDFYPSISWKDVYKFFSHTHQCSPDVARILTKLCTHEYHLALGLITSPLLADQFMQNIDKRIYTMAASRGVIYTRYVDDITLSARFDLRKSGFPGGVKQILCSEGFKTNAKKDNDGRIVNPNMLLTKLRIKRGGKIDVSQEYLAGVMHALDDHLSLSRGAEFKGPYFTQDQLWGRVRYVSWVNPSRRRLLRSKLGAIRWDKVTSEASRRGLTPQRIRMQEVPEQ